MENNQVIDFFDLGNSTLDIAKMKNQKKEEESKLTRRSIKDDPSVRMSAQSYQYTVNKRNSIEGLKSHNFADRMY